MSSSRPEEGLLSFEVTTAEGGLTALQFLSDRLPDVPTAELKRLLRGGCVTRGGRATGAGSELEAGERVALDVDPDALERIEARPLTGFEVLLEAPGLLACFKPAGVAAEPERGGGAAEQPFKGAVLHHLLRAGRDPLPRPRLVHRLDRDTSGVLLVALERDALRDLTEQFEARSVQKEYLAIVRGAPREAEGTIDQPIDDAGRPCRVDPRGKPAVTRWQVLERFRRHALLVVRPETGRQHQIRVHLAAIGHPLAVDPLYGGGEALLLSRLKPSYRLKRGEEERPLLNRLSLHARRIELRLPGAAERVEVVAPVPRDLDVALRQLRRHDAP